MIVFCTNPNERQLHQSAVNCTLVPRQSQLFLWRVGGVKLDCAVSARHACYFFRPGEFMPDSIDSSTAQPQPDPNEKLVKVFDTEQESEALVVKGLLDAAGLDSEMTSASLVQDTFPGLGGMIILVREEDAETARRLIAEQLQVGASDETAEFEAIQDPPAKA
jgi:hypothetical protein